MRRKDINLLYSLTQETKKKSSSNMMIAMIAGVVIIVGLMTFLFVNAKINLANNQDLLNDLQNKIDQTDQLSSLQKKYNEMKAAYESDIAEVIAEIMPGQFTAKADKISKTFIDILMLTDKEDATDAGFDADDVPDRVFDVDIRSIAISGEQVTVECAVSNYLAAWDFADYLAGNKLADYPALDALIAQNAVYFTDVEKNYPGLPQKPATEPTTPPDEGGEGTVEPTEPEKMTFTLKFNVNWEAMNV